MVRIVCFLTACSEEKLSLEDLFETWTALLLVSSRSCRQKAYETESRVWEAPPVET
jgi:hypothetical protein